MILERWVSFDRELSIIAARGRTGELVFYPLVENHHKHGILRVSVCPAPRVTPDLQQMAEAHARALLERLGYVGVLALELFDVRGTLLANEFAPRVHNSGHLTIEGSATSQFENHVRAVMGLPLGSTHSTAPTTMVNLIGGVPDRASILALPDTHLHLYGKASRRARKVGHITVQAENEALLGERVQALMPLVLAAEDG
jgi:5-(carboxyamino)imidazole ribonucleotide synthase